MLAKVSYPIIIIGPIHNGTDEHPGIISRVYDEHDTADGPVRVNAHMFPDGGGEAEYMPMIRLCNTREEARKALGPFRTAFWAPND